MCDCGSITTQQAGPYATGKDLVNFVLRAHGGSVAGSPLPNGGLAHVCQGCGEHFVLITFVQKCPACGGVHAVSPPRANDPQAIQFAGSDFIAGN